MNRWSPPLLITKQQPLYYPERTSASIATTKPSEVQSAKKPISHSNINYRVIIP